MKKVLHLVLLVYDTYRIFLPRFWCVYDSIKTKLLKQLPLKTIICVPCFSMIRSLQQNITTHKSWWSLYSQYFLLWRSSWTFCAPKRVVCESLEQKITSGVVRIETSFSAAISPLFVVLEGSSRFNINCFWTIWDGLISQITKVNEARLHVYHRKLFLLKMENNLSIL